MYGHNGSKFDNVLYNTARIMKLAELINNQSVRTTKQGIDFIHKWESFRSRPYLDVKGVPTIGYGSTFYPNGRKVTMSDTPISGEYASSIALTVIGQFETIVSREVRHLKLEPHQYDMILSFVYNVGPGNFRSSTLLQRLKEDVIHPDIPGEFTKWIKSGGKKIYGLSRRRLQEVTIYYFGYDAVNFT